MLSEADFRPYQPLVIDHMIDVPRCGIWLPMGFGKTSSCLTALDRLYLCGETQPTLVLAPKRVAQSTWPQEPAKWSHLRHIEVSPILGDAKQRAAALRRDVSVYTINYDNIPWLVDHLAGDWPFGTIVPDEATRVKGFRGSDQVSKIGTEFMRKGGTKRSSALADVAWRSKRFIELTGTPSPNGLQDLWGQAWFLDRGRRLGRTFDGFKQRWFRPSWNGYGIEPLPHAQAQIQEALKDLCIALDPKDWFDLKEPISKTIYVDLPPAARKQYQEMEKRMFVEIEGTPIEAFNAAAKTTKCLQLANGAAYLDDTGTRWGEVHTVKLEALESIVQEAAGMPVLVAYHFRSDLARLLKAFPKGRQLDTKQSTIDDWNAGKIPLLFAHPKSAGHGLNLQNGGNIIAFFGHDWNLEERQQIIERIGPVRQAQAGFDRPVFIYDIVARGTVEEICLERVETKREVQDLLLHYMKEKRV